jgi:DNA-binding CsgD family transcriptional regulator
VVEFERRTWHLAQASAEPNEEIALELERVAEIALARGCLAAAGAYMQRATNLSADPSHRARRALTAAQGKIRVGAFTEVNDLLAVATTGSTTELDRAQIDLTRAQLALATYRGADVVPLLLSAATRLEGVDATMARETYLDAFSAAVFAGRLAVHGGGLSDVGEKAALAPLSPQGSSPVQDLFDGLVAYCTGQFAAATPKLQAAVEHFGEDMSPEQELRRLWLGTLSALRIWDDDGWDRLSIRYLELTYEMGALSDLPLALVSRTYVLLFIGDLAGAAALSSECQMVTEAIGSNMAPYGALGLAALRGDESETLALAELTKSDVSRRGEGVGITYAEWAAAALHNGLGQYDKALVAAERAADYEADLCSTIWPVVEVIEAATRCGVDDVARFAYDRLAEMTKVCTTDWAAGLQARCLALLALDNQAEEHYLESIGRLGRTQIRTDLARAHLVYGEWLRRRRRMTDSREQLRTAHRMFEAMGMGGFADRARGELRAAGEYVRKTMTAEKGGELTAQEAQIARLARDGLSNPEIANRLFISVHTVQYHLRKVFAKLGIASRTQLDRVIPK